MSWMLAGTRHFRSFLWLESFFVLPRPRRPPSDLSDIAMIHYLQLRCVVTTEAL
jgi:hypothetical protein